MTGFYDLLTKSVTATRSRSPHFTTSNLLLVPVVVCQSPTSSSAFAPSLGSGLQISTSRNLIVLSLSIFDRRSFVSALSVCKYKLHDFLDEAKRRDSHDMQVSLGARLRSKSMQFEKDTGTASHGEANHHRAQRRGHLSVRTAFVAGTVGQT